MLRKLGEQSRKRYVSPVEFATVHLSLDDVDTGLKYLAKAVEHRCFEVLALNVDPRFATVRKEPRFAKLIRHVGLV